MPPFYFRTNPESAQRIVGASPEGSVKIYEHAGVQDWMRGAMADTGEVDPEVHDTTSLDFLANEAIDAVLVGDKLMHVDADSREALQDFAEGVDVIIRPYN
jgi:hypothetical protein